MSDLAKLRTDLLYFSREIGAPLEAWQVAPSRSVKRTVVIVAPRQSGKSRFLAVMALWRAFRTPGTRVLIVSASEDAARRLLADAKRLATASPLLAGSVVAEQAGLLTLVNGSEIRSVPASEKQVRGWSVDVLLVDEAALVSNDLLLGAAIPTTAARPNAQVFLASSATVASGAFYDFVRTGEAGSSYVETFRWALGDAWWISPSMVEALRESLSEARFRAEMLGEFASGADALFTREALERVVADFPLLALAELRGPARVLAGVDWGATVDLSAITAYARVAVPNDLPTFQVICAEAWRAGTPLNHVVQEIAGSPAHYAALAAETNGLGLPLAQELARQLRARATTAGGGRRRGGERVIEASEQIYGPRREPSVWDPARRAWSSRLMGIHTTAQNKAHAYSALRLLVDRGQIVFPAAATELIRELLMLRVELTPTAERIEAGSGHDDRADSAMLALGPDKVNGRWTTLAERLLDSRRPHSQPDPELPEDLPTVTTPGGVVVPAVPVFQSVSGSDVTGFSIPVGPQPERVGDFLIHP